MRYYMADVADGLCMAVRLDGSQSLVQIDCGCRQGSNVAAAGFRRIHGPQYSPKTLVISHLHADHYLGIACLNNLEIENLVYPGIPDLNGDADLRHRLATAFIVQNFLWLGEQTGIAIADLIEMVARANKGARKPQCHLLYENEDDTVPVSDLPGSQVVWPPRVLAADSAKGVRKVVDRYEEVLKRN